MKKEFWDSGDNWDETYEKYVLRTSSDVVHQFIACVDNNPVGYIQFYWASKVGDGWWEGYPDGDARLMEYRINE